MDYGKAFTYMTEDEKWVNKLLITGGIVLLGILLLPVLLVGLIPLLAVSGYMLLLLQNVMRGEARPLPEWNDFGAKVTKGLNLFAIGVVYSLPSILVACCIFGLQAFAGSGAQNTSSSGSSGSNPLAGTAVLLSLCLNCLSFIYNLFLAVVVPSALIRYAASERLADAFQFREVFDFIRRNANSYIAAVLLSIAAGFVALFGIIACGIGLAFTGVWSAMVQYYLLGQVYRNSLGGATPPTPMTPPPMPTAPSM